MLPRADSSRGHALHRLASHIVQYFEFPCHLGHRPTAGNSKGSGVFIRATRHHQPTENIPDPFFFFHKSNLRGKDAQKEIILNSSAPDLFFSS